MFAQPIPRKFKRARFHCVHFLLCLFALTLPVPVALAANDSSVAVDEQQIAAALQKFEHKHPRLYLDAARVAALRESAKTVNAALFESVKHQADAAVKSGPPTYILHDAHSGDEQLWQRPVGNIMPALAICWLVTQDRAYLNAARDWALASCSYATWGLNRNDGMDLAAGHQMFGLALVYDWCYADLDEATRNTIRETLIKRGGAMFEQAKTGKVWWHKSYLQNHQWVNITGLAAAGLAIYDEDKETIPWVGLVADKYQRTMAALGPDGASHEGVGYWSYGVEYMLKYMQLSRELLGINLYDNPWWRNTASYRLYLGLPQKAWTKASTIVDIADCERRDFYGPDYLLRRIASEYRDRRAQWEAEGVDAAKATDSAAGWLNLLWQDATVKPLAPGDAPALPTFHHFEDLGIVSARSDWSGAESLVVFKCGPYIGQKAIREFTYDPGGGHVHPDANHFVIFGAGSWLIRNDGYRNKWTAQENTLLINERGQLGEGHAWLDGSACIAAKAEPRITRALSNPNLDVMTGEAQKAYPAEFGLTRYRRHLLYLKPNVLIVIDDIALENKAALELRFHPETAANERDGAAFVSRSGSAVLRVAPLTTDQVALSSELIAGQDRASEKKPFSMETIRLKREAAQWKNAVAFSWCGASETPVAVSLRQDGSRWIFNAGGKTVTFDWADESVR